MASLSLPSRTAAAQVEKSEKLPGHLRCSSCEKVVFNAYQTPHGCRLCEACVNQLPLTEKQLCPGKSEACRDEDEEINISRQTCFPDIATRREVGKLQVFCPNSAAGCHIKDKWRNLGEHLASCEFEQVACPQCGQSVLKNMQNEHLRSSCPRRLERCRDCGKNVEHRHLDSEHRNLNSAACCEKFTAACPFGCGEPGLSRAQFLVHLDQCPKKPTACKFRHLGCKTLLPVGDLPEHYRVDADWHIELLDKRLLQLGSRQSTPGAATAAAAAAANSVVGDSSTAASAPAAGDKEAAEFMRRLLSVFEVFKKLQLNVAGWAQTTIDFEELIASLGGMAGLRNLLKSAEDSGRLSDAVRPDPAGGELARMRERLEAIEFRFRHLDLTGYDGVLTWRVADVLRLRGDAGRATPLLSPPFFCCRFGHMLRARLYLNDDSHIAARLFVAQSEYDDILEWPFVASVTFRLVNVRNRADDAVAKQQLDTGDRRPAGRDDSSVGCTEQRLAPVAALASEAFVCNDCLYLEVEVQPAAADSGAQSRRR